MKRPWLAKYNTGNFELFLDQLKWFRNQFIIYVLRESNLLCIPGNISWKTKLGTIPCIQFQNSWYNPIIHVSELKTHQGAYIRSEILVVINKNTIFYNDHPSKEVDSFTSYTPPDEIIIPKQVADFIYLFRAVGKIVCLI